MLVARHEATRQHILAGLRETMNAALLLYSSEDGRLAGFSGL